MNIKYPIVRLNPISQCPNAYDNNMQSVTNDDIIVAVSTLMTEKMGFEPMRRVNDLFP